MKERVQLPQAKLSMKHQDKSRLKHHVDLPSSGSSHESNFRSIQPKSSGSHERMAIKGKTKKSDELVKYMSDVPGYLQGVDTGENFKEKALNVGVLDWSRLEKWKHKQERTIPAGGSKIALSSSCDSPLKTFSGSVSLSETDRRKSQAHRVKLSTQHGTRFTDLETGSRGTLYGQKKIPSTYKLFSGNSLDGSRKGKGLGQKISSETGNSSTNLRNHGMPSRLERNVRAKARIERNNLDEVTSDLGDFPSKLRNNETLLCTEEKISVKKADMKMRAMEYQESDIDLGNHNFPEPKDIVLILPRDFYQNGLSENGTFTDGDSKGADQGEFSGGFQSMEDLSSGVPHSCPLPSRAETNPEPDVLPHCRINVQSTELPEREEKECRSQTPNRRFSFSLGRMGRSSSLKEGQAFPVPQLSSTPFSAKSGPVMEEKRTLHSRSRSSPLRRLLDPFLKPKAAISLHSQKVNLNSSSFRSSDASESGYESIENEKPAASATTVQAFLQLTVKNGLPLFRFVSDNNKHVLAATVRNFTAPEKDNSSENFTFYSVDEVKKRSNGWMNQGGSKEKKCEFAYNIVGQMKVSSTHSLNSNQFVTRESVLFGIDEQDSTKSTIHRELAAVVLRIPGNNYKDVKKGSNGDSASTVAILPGGFHSFPEKGTPSTLIQRWRSGGSCDCGGWDMGCKLQILLSSCNQYNTFSTISITYPIQDRFELFVQEGTRDRPIFSLAPIKNGFYSIAFSTSISLLQAFFISVAVLHPHKFPDHLKDFQKPVINESDYTPARFASNPPLSPVGRV